jgi:co-chaperonin GroES (HSP10)
MKIKPCGYRLLVQADKVEDVTESGIMIVIDERLEKMAQVYGTIIDTGPECWKGDAAWARAGDRVCYVRHAGKFVIDTDTDEEFVILNDEDILCIMEKENE